MIFYPTACPHYWNVTDDSGNTVASVNVTIDNDGVYNRNATINITIYNFYPESPDYEWFGFGISYDQFMVNMFQGCFYFTEDSSGEVLFSSNLINVCLNKNYFIVMLLRNVCLEDFFYCPRMIRSLLDYHLSQLIRWWYLSHRRPAKPQTSLRIWAVSPEPSLFADMQYGSSRRVRPKIGHLAPPGWLRMCVWKVKR